MDAAFLSLGLASPRLRSQGQPLFPLPHIRHQPHVPWFTWQSRPPGSLSTRPGLQPQQTGRGNTLPARSLGPPRHRLAALTLCWGTGVLRVLMLTVSDLPTPGGLGPLPDSSLGNGPPSHAPGRRPSREPSGVPVGNADLGAGARP